MECCECARIWHSCECVRIKEKKSTLQTYSVVNWRASWLLRIFMRINQQWPYRAVEILKSQLATQFTSWEISSWEILQHTATHYNTVQHSVTHCNTLQNVYKVENFDHSNPQLQLYRRFVVCCSVLQCVAVCCSVLQCVAVCCSVLQRVALCCSELQCVSALYTLSVVNWVVGWLLRMCTCAWLSSDHAEWKSWYQWRSKAILSYCDTNICI